MYGERQVNKIDFSEVTLDKLRNENTAASIVSLFDPEILNEAGVAVARGPIKLKGGTMKKLVVIGAMLLMAGCAGSSQYSTFSKAQINGKEIYIGMSQQTLETQLGAPDSVKAHTSSNMLSPTTNQVAYGTSYTRVYGDYTVMLSEGSIVSIWTLNKK